MPLSRDDAREYSKGLVLAFAVINAVVTIAFAPIGINAIVRGACTNPHVWWMALIGPTNIVLIVTSLVYVWFRRLSKEEYEEYGEAGRDMLCYFCCSHVILALNVAGATLFLGVPIGNGEERKGSCEDVQEYGGGYIIAYFCAITAIAVAVAVLFCVSKPPSTATEKATAPVVI